MMMHTSISDLRLRLLAERDRKFFVAGIVLIVCALIVHFACMCSHHYVVIATGELGSDLANIMKHDRSLFGPSFQSQQALQELNETFLNMDGSCHFGMWQFCITANQSNVYVDTCLSWGTEIVLGAASKTLKTRGWIRGVQAMAIVSILIGLPTLALAIVNLVGKAKGDRKKYMHFFIAAGCIVAGILMLVGDLIMAANYTSLVDTPLDSAPDQRQAYPSAIAEVFQKHFHLSWAFGLNVFAVVLAWLGGLVHLAVIKGSSVVQYKNDSLD